MTLGICRLTGLLSYLLLPLSLSAQALEPLWFYLSARFSISGRVGHAMAYDAARSQVVLFGGWGWNDTWVWDGSNWFEKFPVVRPPGRSGHAMAYDSARGQVVLFGGSAPPGGPVDDTWVWDGTNWQQKFPTAKPPARYAPAMAYDAVRAQVVLFGGRSGANLLNDTWVWDGENWTQKFPSNRPAARTYHAMAYDAARGQVVLFGGIAGSGRLNDTWVWDGSNWVQKSPSSVPPPREQHAMAYDAARGQVVLFGGAYLNDTWVWDGSNWGLRLPTSRFPPKLSEHAMAYDAARQEIVLFGGQGLQGTWVWNGTDWLMKPGDVLSPAMAYDAARSQAVLLASWSTSTEPSQTWIWDGLRWERKLPGVSPPARSGHALADDPARERILLFGGLSSEGPLNDLWEWDGSNWARVLPLIHPPARFGHAMATDPLRKQVVLFGGAGSAGDLADTWVWDGVNWVEKFPNMSPPGRSGHAMAFDVGRGQVVLFGGAGVAGPLNDTWVWDGVNWTQKFPNTSPPARSGHALAYGATQQQVVLFGGSGPVGLLNDTWVWDGADWTEKSFEEGFSPSGRSRVAMAQDAARGQIVLLAGADSVPNAAWLFRHPPSRPMPGIVTPGSGTGYSQNFTISFEHPSGAENLQVVNVLWNFWLDGRQACYVAYLPSSRALYLVDDAGNAGGPFAGGLILGKDTHSISNSQCTIHGQGSGLEYGIWTQLVLRLKVDFAGAFAGTRVSYAAARDADNNSGWQRLGVWKVPGATALPGHPEVVKLYPAEWTGRDPETLEVTVRDPQGAGDVSVVNLLVNDWLDGRQACYVAYVPAVNAVFLVDDAGNAGGPFAGGVVLGSSQTAANSQCVIYGEGSSASAAGERLTLRLRVQFKSGFAGNRVVYGAVRDLANNNSGWQAVGRRTVP